jgi:DnaK suppressor protein
VIEVKKPAKAVSRIQKVVVRHLAKKVGFMKPRIVQVQPRKVIAVFAEGKISKKPAVKVIRVKPTVTKVSDILPYRPKVSEEYMSVGMQKHFEEILKTWKANLRESMDRTVNYMKETSTSLSDLSDRATQEEAFGLELRERDRERRLIEKIDESLHNLAEGIYGYCEICGEEIGLRRLEARPTATLCIDCKTLDEIREKQTGGS